MSAEVKRNAGTEPVITNGKVLSIGEERLAEIVDSIVRETEGIGYARGVSRSAYSIGREYFIDVAIGERVVAARDNRRDWLDVVYDVYIRVAKTGIPDQDELNIRAALSAAIAQKRRINREDLQRWLQSQAK